tara:strand:+ start:871 stop:1509 length:639 start_codon:yes stop_codon:yes gene_type:complete
MSLRITDKSNHIELTDKFLRTWKPDFNQKRNIYIRDTIQKNLLCNASKKGSHSFGFDYSLRGVHKSKVFGYYPAMSIEEARLRVVECEKLVAKGLNYDDVFEIERLPQMVYFLENSQGLIKIGRSKDWVHRIKQLVMSTEGIRLIGIRLETEVFNETRLHNLYQAFRFKGNEYFKDEKGFIKQLITQAVVYHVSDEQVDKMITSQERVIYDK